MGERWATLDCYGTLRARTPTEADVPVLVSLINDASGGGTTLVDEEEVRVWLSSSEVTGIAFAVFETDARVPLAYADVTPPAEGSTACWLDVRIPERTATDAVLDAVLAWAEEHRRRHAAAAFRVSVPSTAPAGAMLAARGFEVLRHSFQMRIDLDGPLPPLSWPDGVAVRTFRTGEERLVYEVCRECFQDDWEPYEPYEEWAHFMLGPDFDPALWFLAADGAELAGVSLCRPSHPGRPGVGWVRTLGVRPPWRRRGLGLALLVHSFRELQGRGAESAGLGVWADNVTGAVRLYERAGMRVEERRDTYERALS